VVILKLRAVLWKITALRKTTDVRRYAGPGPWQTASRISMLGPSRAWLRRLRAAQLRQRLRQLGQKNAWYLNFDVNADLLTASIR
jgi:hypothetical protein